MNNFLDKFGMLIVVAIVGLMLVLTGIFTGHIEVLGLGLTILGASFGLPFKAAWSAPVIDPELKAPMAAPIAEEVAAPTMGLPIVDKRRMP